MFRKGFIFKLGGGDLGREALKNYKEKEIPNQPHRFTSSTHDPNKEFLIPFANKIKMMDGPLYDDTTKTLERLRWQEPARSWHLFSAEETLMLEEHDKEEWNDKPYVTVNHLYEQPMGCEDRPMRFEGCGNPGDKLIMWCRGNCTAHVPQGSWFMHVRGYNKHRCILCDQYFYVHNRPWLVMHPDWTDDPAEDDGPAFTFAEVEAEFDRDFHEFGLFLNVE